MGRADGRGQPLSALLHPQGWPCDRPGCGGREGSLFARSGRRANALFHHLLQALIELAPAGGDERALLEAISNHVVARKVSETLPMLWPDGLPEDGSTDVPHGDG